MRTACVWDAADQLEPKTNAARFPQALELRVRLLEAGLIRHLRRHVGPAIHALDRHVGVQLEGSPYHHRFVLRARRDRKVEAPLPEVTPGADGVRIDINTHMSRPLAWIVPSPLMGEDLNKPYGRWPEEV